MFNFWTKCYSISLLLSLCRSNQREEEGGWPPDSLFARLISHQPAVLFSQKKPATSNQPAVLFSQNKPAPAISHQPTEQAGDASPLITDTTLFLWLKYILCYSLIMKSQQQQGTLYYIESISCMNKPQFSLDFNYSPAKLPHAMQN
jgi:hypothetical protein